MIDDDKAFEIVCELLAGLSIRDAATEHNCSEHSVARIKRHFLLTGGVHGRLRRQTLSNAEETFLLVLCSEHPELYLSEYLMGLRDLGIKTSITSVYRRLLDHNITRKKLSKLAREARIEQMVDDHATSK
jgi:transposase